MPSKLLDDITKIAGHRTALAIARGWGGRYLYIPEQITETHPIALAAGYEQAKALSSQYGGQQIEIPAEQNLLLDIRNAMILDEIDKGKSMRGVALEYGLSERMVRKIDSARRKATEPDETTTANAIPG